jgi:hypothetical protein
MNKRLKSKKGASLVLILMVASIIFILGVTILGIGVAEARFSTRQVDKTQAYLSAKSGVEIGLDKIKNALASGNYEDVNTLYDDINVPFSGSVNTGEDTYSVTFVDDGLVTQNRIKILGESIVNNVKGTTALTIQFTSPGRIPLDWLNNGNIINKGYHERTTGPVVVDLVKLLGHSPKKSSVAVTTWFAPSIHFVDDEEGFALEVTAKQLILKSNLISFRNKIYTKEDNDCLVLSTFNAQGFRDAAGNRLLYDNSHYIPEGWGVVVLYKDMVRGMNKNSSYTVFSPGYYAFAPGMALSSSADRNNASKMIEITNQSTKDYIDAVIKSETTLGFEPTQIRWSNN